MDYFLGQKYTFNVMAKPSGSACNINCTYCYYLEKKNLYPGTNHPRMSPEVLDEYIQQYIASQHVPVVNFVWQGGEPCLMGIEFYRRAIELQNKYANGKQITNSFQTNGILLNNEWCDFFKQNEFLVGISVDGPEHIHDHYRKSNSGSPTWSRVMKGVELLRKHQVEFNTLSVVNDYSSQFPLDIYRFLKDIGSQFHQYIPVVERKVMNGNNNQLQLISPDFNGTAKVTEWSVKSNDYGEFLITIFNEWVKMDVGQYFVQIFDATLASWAGHDPGLCIYNETCGDALVMEHNGTLYSCDHYVYPQNQLGNILENKLIDLFSLPEHTAFGKQKAQLPQYCHQCDFKFACNGECPKHRFIDSPTGEPGLNYLCKGLKKYYQHVSPFMDFMVNELKNQRPPSNIMEAVKTISTSI